MFRPSKRRERPKTDEIIDVTHPAFPYARSNKDALNALYAFRPRQQKRSHFFLQLLLSVSAQGGTRRPDPPD
jgi:hypothetical protein